MNNNIKSQLVTTINQLEEEINEIEISELLDYIYELLSENEDQTINVLNELDENQADWISSVFEELSFHFQSQQFIDSITLLSNKYPDNEDIRESVIAAKEAFN